MVRKCANGGIEIHWRPTVINGAVYCCLGCSRGGPCDCDYSNLPHGADRLVLALQQGEETKVTGRVAPRSGNGLLP